MPIENRLRTMKKEEKEGRWKGRIVPVSVKYSREISTWKENLSVKIAVFWSRRTYIDVLT